MRLFAFLLPAAKRPRDLALAIDLVAAGRLYGHLGETVFAVDPPKGEQPPKIHQVAKLPAPVTSMIAARERLIVVTEQGHICCFSVKKAEPVVWKTDAPTESTLVE